MEWILKATTSGRPNFISEVVLSDYGEPLHVWQGLNCVCYYCNILQPWQSAGVLHWCQFPRAHLFSLVAGKRTATGIATVAKILPATGETKIEHKRYMQLQNKFNGHICIQKSLLYLVLPLHSALLVPIPPGTFVFTSGRGRGSYRDSNSG